MRKYEKRALLGYVLLIIIIIVLALLLENIANQVFKNILRIVLIIFLLSYVIIIRVFYRNVLIRERKKSDEITLLVMKKEFDKARDILDIKLEAANLQGALLMYKTNLVTLELTLGHNEKAKFILDTTKWHGLERDVYYYKLLFFIKEHNKEKINLYFKKLQNANIKYKNHFDKQIYTIECILNYQKTGIKKDVETIFPIVKDLLDLN